MKKFVLVMSLFFAAVLMAPAAVMAEEDAAPLTARAVDLPAESDGISRKGASHPFSTEQEKNIDHDIEAKGVYRDKGGAAGRLGSESAGGLRGGVDLSINR